MRTRVQELSEPLTIKISLKITHLKCNSHLHGTNDLSFIISSNIDTKPNDKNTYQSAMAPPLRFSTTKKRTIVWSPVVFILFIWPKLKLDASYDTVNPIISFLDPFHTELPSYQHWGGKGSSQDRLISTTKMHIFGVSIRNGPCITWCLSTICRSTWQNEPKSVLGCNVFSVEINSPFQTSTGSVLKFHLDASYYAKLSTNAPSN